MRIALTIDVEDYFHGLSIYGVCPESAWPGYAQRSERLTYWLLDELDRLATRATFFFLGWMADRYPALVREVSDRGHEVACHGYSHELVYKLTREEFKVDLLRAKNLIESRTGEAVKGYRAPAFSIVQSSAWALDTLLECGFTFDSSIFPISGHDNYGIPSAPPTPWEPRPGLLELPPATTKIFGRNVPCAGGGYFRIAPYSLTRVLLKQAVKQHGPLTFYVHPWEFDMNPVKLDLPMKVRLRHYLGRTRTRARFAKLFEDFQFGAIRDVFASDLERNDSNATSA